MREEGDPLINYGICSEVERLMGVQGKKLSAGKLESREDVKQRLGRVARNLTTKFIHDYIGDLAERRKKL